MGGEDEGGDHTEVEGEGEREDRLDRVQLQHRYTLVVRQGHLCTVHIVANPDPGSGVFLCPWIREGKKSGSEKKHPESYLLELSNNFRDQNYLNSFCCGSGSGMEKFGSRIQDKHLGSAILVEIHQL